MHFGNYFWVSLAVAFFSTVLMQNSTATDVEKQIKYSEDDATKDLERRKRQPDYDHNPFDDEGPVRVSAQAGQIKSRKNPSEGWKSDKLAESNLRADIDQGSAVPKEGFMFPPTSLHGDGYDDDVDDDDDEEEKEIRRNHDENDPEFDPPKEMECDKPECFAFDCDGAGAPPQCPSNVTICRSGCACIRYCLSVHTLFCYETVWCNTKRRFFMGYTTEKPMQTQLG